MQNIQAFIITLKGENDSGIESLRERLANAGIAPVVHKGVDGRKLAAGDYFRDIQPYRRQSGMWMSPSEVGCALSHKMVLSRIASENLRAAVVLEDDVLLDDISIDRIKSLHSDKSLGSAWVSLGGQEGLEVFTDRLRGSLVPNQAEAWEIHPLCYGLIHRTVGYIVGSETAQSYVRLMDEGIFVVDDFTYAYKRGAIRRLVLANCVGHPLALEHSNIQSERDMVQASRLEEHLPLRQRLFREVRRTVESRVKQRRESETLRASSPIAWGTRFG